MADIKVSEMQSATSLNPDDLIMVVQSGSNKKATFDLFKEIPIDNLNSTSTTDALSANQGKVLNDKILGLNIPSVVDNLTSTSKTNALSANQGKILNDNITNLTTYSTEEQRIGTWIDGKPIYRKVISKSITDYTGEITVNLGTSNINTFVNGKVLIDTADFTAIDTCGSSTAYYIRKWVYRKTNNTVTITTNVAGSFTGTIYVIVEYTKTTD